MLKINTIYNIAISKKYPVSMVHFVTMRCNARCSFCFIDFDDPKTFKNELKLSEIEKISKTLGPTISNVNLTGGEPFARKDFLEIANLYLKNSNIRSLFITSNGSLPDRMKKFVETLAPRYPKKNITFSLSIDDKPQEHDKIRKIKGLFENCIESYNFLKSYKKNILSNIAITVSHENHDRVLDLYYFLKNEIGVNSITCTIVRDEGVYSIPKKIKKNILDSYTKLTKIIREDINNNQIIGYRNDTTIGKFLNSKNSIMNEQITKMYLNNDYLSPCHASSLFGVMYANGDVYPCEILDKKIGNIKDSNYDLMKLWLSQKNIDIKNQIISSNCRCSYECAWSFNILGNKQYYPKLLKNAYFK